MSESVTAESPRLLRGFSRGAQFGAHLRLEDDVLDDENEFASAQEVADGAGDEELQYNPTHKKNSSSSAILGEFHEDSLRDSNSERDKVPPATVESVVWSIDQNLNVNGKGNGSASKRPSKMGGSPDSSEGLDLAGKKKRSGLRSLLCCVREPRTVCVQYVQPIRVV